MAEIYHPSKFLHLGEYRKIRARFSRVHSLPAKSQGDHLAFNRRLRMLYAQLGPFIFKLSYGKFVFNEPLDLDQISYLAKSYPLIITELKDGLFFIGAKHDAKFPAYMLKHWEEFDEFEYVEILETGEVVALEEPVLISARILPFCRPSVQLIPGV